MTFDLNEKPDSEADWQQLLKQYDISGRLTRAQENKSGDPVREYAHAGGFARLTYLTDQRKLEVERTTKSTANAIIGIHRHRGYGGGIGYNLYAFLLDLFAVSLIVFTFTGIIMWMRLLKNDKWAWSIFIGGFLYFGITLLYLTYG